MSLRRSLIGFAWVAAPKVVWGMAQIAINIALMPYFGEADFGVFALCLTLVLFLSEGMLGAAVDLAVMRHASLHRSTDPKKSLRIERTSLTWKLWLALTTGGLTFLFATPLSGWLFHDGGRSGLIWLVWGAACGMLLHSSSLVHLQVRERFVLYGLFDGLQVAIKLIGIALAIYAVRNADPAESRLDPSAILIWYAIAPCVAFACFFLSPHGASLRRERADRESSRVLLNYVRWNLLTFAFTALVSRVDMLFLTTFSTIKEVGKFAAGQTLAAIPQLLGTYLGIILQPQIMPRYQAGTFRDFLIKIQLTLFAASLVILGGFYSLQNELTGRLLSEEFSESGHVLMVLMPAAVASMSTFPLIVAFLMFVRPRFILAMEFVLVGFVLLAYWYAIPRWGALGAAWVTSSFIVLKSLIALTMSLFWADNVDATDESRRLPHSA